MFESVKVRQNVVRHPLQLCGKLGHVISADKDAIT